MGVPLQLILGILLVLVTCSFADQRNLRQIREAPPPLPAPIHNVTEINNRDLNKIVNVNPKTEALDTKSKNINNVLNFEEFPIKSGTSDEERQNNNVHSAQKNETKDNENSKGDVVKLAKEKLREDSSRAIDIDASKFWSSDFHSKNNVFTLSPTPYVATIRTLEKSFEGTRHPSFDTNSELTTPATKLFDKKFKETVESVEQKLDDINLDNGEHDSEEEEEENNNENLSVDDLLNNKPENSRLEFEKTKTMVNNETIDKNAIHKDLNIEQTKKVNFENSYNDTKVYDVDTNKGDIVTTQADNKNETSTTTKGTTRKGSFFKESVGEKTASHMLSNNIETGFGNPIKGVSTTPASSTTLEFKGEINDTKLYTGPSSFPQSKPLDLPVTTSTTVTTLTIAPTVVIRTNVSDQENIIPLQLGTERTLQKKHLFEPLTTTDNSRSRDNSQKEIVTVVERLAVDVTTTTTETIPSTTEIFEATTDSSGFKNILSDGTTTDLPEEGTTTFIVENATEVSDTTVETSTVTMMHEESTSEGGLRTSKSLDHSIVTEQTVTTREEIVETSTKEIGTESTIKNELDSTTLNNGKIEEFESKDNIIQKVRDIEVTSTEEVTMSTIAVNEETTTLYSISEGLGENHTTTEKMVKTSSVAAVAKVSENTTEPINTKVNIATELPNATQSEMQSPTTTEFAFVHIENTANNHTTLLPEILSPLLNYSTSMAPENEQNKIRKIVLNNKATEDNSSSSSSTTPSSRSVEAATNVATTTAANPTENSFTKDGGNKGKIAAIAISCVGAFCLILLAGLLYIMKKRQKRLNYGPRCRPVSLDDYSIDNLSVYNSVRRKGGARMSKRSFGNPAFDDPVAPTHPLNFQALASFSTNFEDVKAEFEEIPQITARTSELPDGCDTKNRYANVIPLPETRVYLKLIDGYSNSDYINANYVTGPKNVKGYYIATQGPLQNTVDDFWRMVWEQQAKVILMLTHLVENGLEKCVDYLPESEVLECSRLFGDFQITLKKREVKEKYIISCLQLKNMVSNSWREVTHFWYLGWPEKGVPTEANSLIAFLIEARSYMKTVTMDKKDGLNSIQNGGTLNEHNPVVIHCSPGTGRTGVAIACDIAIREFETSRLVDIPKIVYRIRRDRANAIQTKEQYMFIYKVVSLYATKLTGGALESL